MKCNFPTKVKFMGLTERKTMFLTSEYTLELKPEKDVPACKSIYLNPLNTTNISSIMNTYKVDTKDTRVSNWDKMCILGIYIKLQPIRNQFDGAAGAASISQIQCTYSTNNVDDVDIAKYDKACKKYKQIFTFNSNEAFTIYVPAPTTMEDVSACVHKSKTWWSIANMEPEDEGEDDDDDDKVNGFKLIRKDEDELEAGNNLLFGLLNPLRWSFVTS